MRNRSPLGHESLAVAESRDRPRDAFLLICPLTVFFCSVLFTCTFLFVYPPTVQPTVTVFLSKLALEWEDIIHASRTMHIHAYYTRKVMTGVVGRRTDTEFSKAYEHTQ